jgi:thiamine monophosphate synthase
MDEAKARLVELVAEAKMRALQLRIDDRDDEALEVEKLVERWEPVARGELFPYGAVSVLPSGPNWWN